jgi:CMP-N,N'-diacetyllegionaminic acid synthase
LDPVLHALDWLAENEDYHPEWLLLLQPTSPLRTAADIDAAYQLALDHDAESVLGVTEAQSHPMWTKTIEGDGKLRDFIDQKEALGIRQELSPVFVINGAIYLIRVGALVRNRSFSSDETVAYRMPPERSWDIDTELDFKIAAFLKNDALNQV